MSQGQYRNSIHNLVRVYIPEWLEEQKKANKDHQILVKEGKEYVRVFTDPSGVLDIWARATVKGGANLNITTESFEKFLCGADEMKVGRKRGYQTKRVIVCLAYRQDPPPSDDEDN